jgi:S1-C subfamily serine protease
MRRDVMTMKLAFTLFASAMALALPIAPAMVQAQLAKDDWLPSQQHGMGFAKDPSGAIITKVARDSAAERAGVTEGMVITHIDGLPLRELTAVQIARLFAGTGGRVELKIRGSGTVTVSDGNRFGSSGAAVRAGSGSY